MLNKSFEKYGLHGKGGRGEAWIDALLKRTYAIGNALLPLFIQQRCKKQRYPAKSRPVLATVGREQLKTEISRFTGPSGHWTRAVITRIPSKTFLVMTTPNNRFLHRIKQRTPAFNPLQFARYGPGEDSLPYLELQLARQGNRLKTVIHQHEGRHRAASVMQAGGYDIPVVLFYGKKSPVSGESMTGIKVFGQFGRGSFVVQEAASLIRGQEAEAWRIANGLPKHPE